MTDQTFKSTEDGQHSQAGRRPIPARLRWQCRRGMRELDLMLLEFLERGYPLLAPAQQAQFETLLEFPDQVLLEWLLGHSVPSDRDVCKLVERIRACIVAGV